MNTNNPNEFFMAQMNKKIRNLQVKYIFMLILLVIALILLYAYNPYNLITKFSGPTIFLIILLGLFLICSLIYNIEVIKNPNATFDSNNPSNIAFKTFFILGSVAISSSLIVLILWSMGVFHPTSTATKSNAGQIFLDTLIVVVMLALAYKALTVGGHLQKNPAYSLVLNIILYIPCLLTSSIEQVQQQQYAQGMPKEKTSTTIYILLAIECILLVIYFLYPMIMFYFSSKMMGGKMLVNQPVYMNQQNSIASYEDLNGSQDPNYRYGLSAWFYLDSAPLNTSSAYLHFTPILSYGDKPSVKYNALTNTLMITVKTGDPTTISMVDNIRKNEKQIPQTDDPLKIKEIQQTIANKIATIKSLPVKYELDENGDRIIYQEKGILLQKWNHLVLNYDGGVLDIFLNGKLVKSAVEVVPYITLDSLVLGSNSGISGGIANVVYYKEPLDVAKIYYIYDTYKDKNPPSIPNNPQTIIITKP